MPSKLLTIIANELFNLGELKCFEDGSKMSSKQQQDPMPVFLPKGSAEGYPIARDKNPNVNLQVKPISAAFGDIVALLSRSPLHRQMSIADLEWLVVPAILHNQFAVAEAKLPDGNTVGVAFVTWARVSSEVDKRLTQDPRYPMRLHPSEWKSGGMFWIIDGVGEAKLMQALIAKVAKDSFGGMPFKIVQVAPQETEKK
ncbi:toxin-activating lysine-acyltransferase [Rhodomicrobium sp.]|uniref:toxin-activating lysine-acyltransferase n=1 Tax=Rhodomicrobium sp. TaxID=2720632 RepID=UPI0039E629C7